MTNQTTWMETFTKLMQQGFGQRLQFVGLQGSCARNEDTPASDIDVVVLLDHLHLADLSCYQELTANLFHRDRLCGFVGGIDTLQAWDRAELVTFCLDTTAYFGSLEAIQSTLTEADARRALHSGACSLYHACAHNFCHAQDREMLHQLQKSLFFLLRVKHYCESGTFVVRKTDLLPLLNDRERSLLTDNHMDFEPLSAGLLDWATSIITHDGSEGIT